MIALVKFVHIAAIAVWSAGLIALPAFYRQLATVRAENPEADLHGDAPLRLQRAARLTYVGIVSPAAFIAVATGLLLIFQRDVLAPWFSLKLGLVATLVVAHVLASMKLVRMFDRPGGYPAWRHLTATGTKLVLATAIITLTLTKPMLTDAYLPAVLSEPGGLKSMLECFNPWKRP